MSYSENTKNKWLAFVIFLCACLHLQGQGALSVTPNVSLVVPPVGSSGYAAYINSDLYLLDNLLGGTTALPNLVITGNLTVGGTVSFANVNPNPGTYGSSTQCAVISVNSSGLITSASSVACAGGSGGITALTGDVTGSGTGSIATTLATVNSNVGTFGTSTQCATFTVNAKGLVTAASQSTNCPGGSGGTVIAGTVQNEVPVGAINGTNATFTISHTPSPTYIQLYRNGLLQALGTDYSLTGTTITFITASIPQSGDTLAAWYTYGTGGGGSGNATTVNGAAIPNNAVIVSNISGQLVNGNAAVVNINNRGVLRDYQNALDNGNFSTNGIASAITACGTSVTCAVLAPPAYPTGELVPGTSITNWFDGSPPSAITTSSTITVHDQRWGMDMSTILNCLGYNVPGSRICNVPQYDYIESLANLRVFDNLGPEVIVMNAMDGGTNQGNAFLSGLQTNKINWFGGGHTVNRWTAGQAEGAGVSMNCYGLGDCLGRSDTLHCYIGPNADSDEGCEWWDAEEFGPPDEPTGTVGSYSSNLLTVSSWTHGQGHQGQGRFVIRENAGTLTGTLAATNPISSPGNGPTVVTVSGTLTASTVVGTTGAFSANPSVAGLSYTATVTPTFTTGNISLITSSTQVCVADPDGGIEAVYPTSVSGGSFTATFRKPHAANSILAVGGLSCTYGFSLNYENVSNSNNHLTSNVQVQNIVNTLHNVVPIIYTDTTHLHLFYATNGQWDTWQALYTSSNNGYTIYPMAELTTVQYQGQVGNVMTLAPNNAGFVPGDTFGVPSYFSKAMGPGHFLIENYWPDSSFNSGGFGIQYNKPLGINNSLFSLFNNTDPALYANEVIQPPQGITINGYAQHAISMQYVPSYYLFNIGGPNPGLLDAYPIKLFNIANQDSLTTPTPTGSSDNMYYDPYGSNEYWQWTTGARSGATYSMYTQHMDINGGSLSMEEFTGGTQVGISLTGYVIGVGVSQPAYWAFGVGCTSPCTTAYNVLSAQNATLQDYVGYSPSTKAYSISANSNSVAYTFGSTLFTSPWPYQTAGVDSATNQNYYGAMNFVFGGVATPFSQPPCNSSYVGWFSPAYYGTLASTIEYCTNRGGAYQWTNLNSGIESITYASTLTFSPVIPTSQTNLTGNVTSWTLAGGTFGQIKTLIWCQDTVGGRTTGTTPSNVHGFAAIGSSPNTCSSQQFIQLLTPNEWQAINVGVQNVPE